MEERLDSVIEDNRSLGTTLVGLGQEAIWTVASRRGDVLAFNRLVLRWEKAIYNLTLRMLQDPDEAAEATQETFLSAYKNIRRFRQDAKFSTWLYRIAVNQCITRLRHKPPGVHYSLDDRGAGALPAASLPACDSHEADLVLEESRKRVRRALGNLPPEQRAAVELKFYQDLTFEEIASILETPMSTVKSRFYSGLEALRVRLGGLRQEP